MIRGRNNLMCNLFVQRTQGKLSPIVLNNKTIDTYCTVKPVGWRWSKLLMPAKALGVGTRGKSG